MLLFKRWKNKTKKTSKVPLHSKKTVFDEIEQKKNRGVFFLFLFWEERRNKFEGVVKKMLCFLIIKNIRYEPEVYIYAFTII